MTTVLRLVRFTRVTAFVAAACTLCCAVLIVGWQTVSWLKEGTWPVLRLSTVIKKLKGDRGEIYVIASADEIEKSLPTSLVDALLGVPAIVPLLVAFILMVAFYLWLKRTENQYLQIDMLRRKLQADSK